MTIGTKADVMDEWRDRLLEIAETLETYARQADSIAAQVRATIALIADVQKTTN